ncbi:MAG TPA: hypothetical protein VH088_06415 [Terriglobales bacterium]|nr:hypothetical protein [Terriglobales bacterium]
MDDKRRTLQEVCELATKEFDTHRLSALVEEILELLAESQAAKNKPEPAPPEN